MNFPRYRYLNWNGNIGFLCVVCNIKQRELRYKKYSNAVKADTAKYAFLLQLEDKCQLGGYRTRLICSEWIALSECKIRISGLNLDKV